MKSRRLYPILAIISALFFALAIVGSVFHHPEKEANDSEKIVKSKVGNLFSLLQSISSDPELLTMLDNEQEDFSVAIRAYLHDKLPVSHESSLYVWEGNDLVYWDIGEYNILHESPPRVRNWDVMVRDRNGFVKVALPGSGTVSQNTGNQRQSVGIHYVLPFDALYQIPADIPDPQESISPSDEYLHAFLTREAQSSRAHFVLTLCLFGYVFLFIYVFVIAHQLTTVYPKSRVLIGLLGGIIVLRLFGYFFPLSHPLVDVFYKSHFFGPGSLADWLLNVLLGFGYALFFYAHFPDLDAEIPEKRKKVFAFLSYLGFGLSSILFGYFIKAIIYNPYIHLDINIVENFTLGGLVLLFAAFILILSVFIVMTRLFLTIQKFELTWKEKVGFFSAALVISAFVVLASNLGFNLILWVISLVIIMLLFDLFLDSSMRDFTWISVWLLVLSLFSTVLFTHFYMEKLRKESIQALEYRMTVPDQQLVSFVQALNKKMAASDESQTYESILGDVVFSYPGIRSQYDFSILRRSSVQPSDTISGIAYSYENTWPEMVYFPLKGARENAVLKAEMVGTNIYAVQSGYSNYEHILYGTGDWTLYDQRVITNNESLFFPPTLDTLSRLPAPPDETVRDTQFIRDNTIYTLVEKGEKAALGRQDFDGLLQPMSFFSFHFILSLLIFGLMLVMHRFVRFLPTELHQYFVENLSIRNKIQFSVLAILIAAFTVVGIVSANFYKRSYKETLERTVKEYYQKVKRAEFQENQIMKVFEGIPGNFILFDENGKAIQNRNYRERNYMPYEVVRKIKLSHTLDRFDEIWPGSLVLPFALDVSRTVFLVYPEITEVPEGFYRFINLLLNAFVFLLLISSALSFSISNTIISPLTELGNKLKEFSLGKRNESIAWKQPDELGTLIQAYNDMVDKLEQSAELLAHSEREVAWREMAKQVAHEIKNPLTPMKLSIQHMELRINEAEAEEAREIVQHVSRVLIEQIDNLSRIASEFSSFANLPKPEYEEILLNDLVASVYDLFRTRSNIRFNLYVPIDELLVQADRTHLIRVMNNLMKNAVQAIPPDREGHIVIRLLEKNGHAVVRVEDNGKGIEDELQEKVFFPNFTTKSSGTGLGLAISKNIIETFDGSIYFIKNKPEGTIFIFELPLVN